MASQKTDSKRNWLLH